MTDISKKPLFSNNLDTESGTLLIILVVFEDREYSKHLDLINLIATNEKFFSIMKIIKEYLMYKRILEEQNSASRRVFFWLFLLAFSYKRSV